jgi:hypothetical protein
MSSRLTASSDGLLSKGASIDSLDDETEDTLKVKLVEVFDSFLCSRECFDWGILKGEVSLYH